MGTLSFDRAADYYDATRALPPEVHARITGLLLEELAGRRPVLEIGVGTGRIARPLVAGGVDLIGMDISAKMLQRLVDNAGGVVTFPLAVADVRSLPIDTGAVAAVVASHVLHLVADWRATVEEAFRVIRPGGVLLVDFGGGAPAPWGETAAQLMEAHGVRRVRPGVSGPGPVEAYLANRTRVRALAPVSLPVTRSLARDLDEWEGQIHSWTWSAAPEQMATACAAVRRWAAESSWPLERPVALERTIRWWAFERLET